MAPTTRTARAAVWKPCVRAVGATSSAVVSTSSSTVAGAKSSAVERWVATVPCDQRLDKKDADVENKKDADMETQSISDGGSTRDGNTSDGENDKLRKLRTGSEHSDAKVSPRISSTTVFARDALLRMRSAVKAETPPKGSLIAMPRPETPKKVKILREPKQISPLAKAAAQYDSCEARLRAVKSMLNKLTLEKFDELCPKIVALCNSGDDLDVVATEIFQKALVQHNFATMYADLCQRFFYAFGGEAGFGRELQWALLRLCRGCFQDSLSPLGDDVDEEARALHKRRGNGNLRFLGELIARGMIGSTDIFSSAADLMKLPLAPEKLEALAVFLTVVGPAFDRNEWPHYEKLQAIFDDVRGFTSNAAVPSRVQFLLRDLLDLRKAGWKDMKLATRNQGPKKLDEVAAETNRKHVPSKVLRPSLPCEPKIAEQSKPTDFRVDVADFVPLSLQAPAEAVPSKPKMKRLMNKKVVAPVVAEEETQ